MYTPFNWLDDDDDEVIEEEESDNLKLPLVVPVRIPIETPKEIFPIISPNNHQYPISPTSAPLHLAAHEPQLDGQTQKTAVPQYTPANKFFLDSSESSSEADTAEVVKSIIAKRNKVHSKKGNNNHSEHHVQFAHNAFENPNIPRDHETRAARDIRKGKHPRSVTTTNNQRTDGRDARNDNNIENDNDNARNADDADNNNNTNNNNVDEDFDGVFTNDYLQYGKNANLSTRFDKWVHSTYIEFMKDIVRPEIVARTFPADLWFSSRDRPNCKSFLLNLYDILKYTENDIRLQLQVGAGWVSERVFFIMKRRFIIVARTNINTLNFKMRNLGMKIIRHSHRMCFWKGAMLNRHSDRNDFFRFKSKENGVTTPKKSTPNVLLNDRNNIFLPLATILLQNIIFFPKSAFNMNSIAFRVTKIWEEVLRLNGVFIVDRTFFLVNLADYLVDNIDAEPNPSVPINSEGGPLNFTQFCISSKLKRRKAALNMLNFFFLEKKNDSISLTDFCNVYGHFGPEKLMLNKMHVLLTTSSKHGNCFEPCIHTFDFNKEVTATYFSLYSNGFVIRFKQGWSFHLYNQIDEEMTKEGYLVDDFRQRYASWEVAIASLKHSSKAYFNRLTIS